MTSEPSNKNIFTIQEYLSNASLPTFRKSTSQILSTARVERASPWPEYFELQKTPGTRALQKVRRTENGNLVRLALDFFSKTKIPLINTSKFANQECFLRLPSPGYVSYEKGDIRFLRGIDNEEHYMILMQDYVLRTISESLRIIGNFAPDSFAAASLKFERASHLCPAHHGRWDILALPGTSQCPYPFFVFLVPPSELGIADLMDFCNEHEYAERKSNVNPLDKPAGIQETLWAVINDTCKDRGRFFAVSNYTRWAFGELSPTGKVACITFPYEAPLLKPDGMASVTLNLGCNPIELLTFWLWFALRNQKVLFCH